MSSCGLEGRGLGIEEVVRTGCTKEVAGVVDTFGTAEGSE